MSHNHAAIAIKQLTIHAPGAKGVKILGPIDLEIAKGEHALIVGPSGCGKSTLLRAIAGLCVPSSGSISLDGQPASEPGRLCIPPERRSVGMLFQGAALWPHMSASKTLGFVLKNAKLDAGKKRIAELLGLVRLDGFEKRMPATLSGGERQRLALARAMATNPSILLLDEPLGPLDMELRSDLLRTLQDLHQQQGWTTLHVTHDPVEAKSIADRVLHIQDGQLASDEKASGDVSNSPA